MEKLVWLHSYLHKHHDSEKYTETGSEEVNRLLAQGWTVKSVTSNLTRAGEKSALGQAYVVLEKRD